MNSNAYKGFTLIEVMVALAIFALIGVGIMQVTTTQLANTLYLEQRLMSQWLADNLINEMKVERKKWNINRCDGSRSGETEFLEQKWKYSLKISSNPFNIEANQLTGDYGKNVCQIELELFFPGSENDSAGIYRGYVGVNP